MSYYKNINLSTSIDDCISLEAMAIEASAKTGVHVRASDLIRASLHEVLGTSISDRDRSLAALLFIRKRLGRPLNTEASE